MSELSADKKGMLKEIVKQLHDGVPPQEVKEKFKQILKDTSSEDVAKIEQELVKEGMPREELQRLCDVHLAVFGEHWKNMNCRLLPDTQSAFSWKNTRFLHNAQRG
jgi:hypothetical protein